MVNPAAPVNVESAASRTYAGDRLRQERERLHLSQVALAEQGGTSRRTQISWEKGESWPSGEYLARVAVLGLDVLYVVTGERAITELSNEERRLLEIFGALSPEAKTALLGIAEALAVPRP